MILLEHGELFQVWWGTLKECLVGENIKVCLLNLNALSFGYASNTEFCLKVYYDASFAKCNFERPNLPQYYETPRSVLRNVIPPIANTIPAPSMPSGYRSEEMRKFVDADFPREYYKVPWEYPCRDLNRGRYKLIHPGEDRLLTNEEMEAIYGGPIDSVPERIRRYVNKQMGFFINKSWGDQDFEARYDKFTDKWDVKRDFLQTPNIKHFDFTQYTPRLCHPMSDRYPARR